MRGAGQGSPGWVAHGKLHAGRSLAAIRWAATMSCFDALVYGGRLAKPYPIVMVRERGGEWLVYTY